MVFSSLTFLFLFFPAVFALYYISRSRTWRNGVLLTASLLFYAWGEPKNIVMLLSATAVAYGGGLLIHRFSASPVKKKAALTVTVILLLSNLFVFKYLNFATVNLSALFPKIAVTDIALPIGVSFYTFQILSYVIDLYRGNIALQRSPLRLLLYVSFFPQLIAGPIVRYSTIESEMSVRHEALNEVDAGFKRFIIGLAKKVLIANNVATVAQIIYAGDRSVYGSAMYAIAALAYTLQIYYDFSGYSDMAIGLGQMFGFHFLENFRHPYAALSVTDFWRRWHISLSSWFRDYVYIPLGGNRVNRSRWLLNLMVVWALTGLWHGASWNFVLWGLYYGVLLIIEKLLLGDLLEKLPKALRWLYTFFIVNVGWIIFNFTDFSQLLSVLGQTFLLRPTQWLNAFGSELGIFQALIWLPLGLLFMLPIPERLKPKAEGAGALIINDAAYLLLLLVCIVFLLSSTYNPFIYFRF